MKTDNAMTKEQAIQHNKAVIDSIIESLIENQYVDPIKFILDPTYAIGMISIYMEAANTAREMMGMPQLVLYDIEED